MPRHGLAEVFEWCQGIMRTRGAELRFLDPELFDELTKTGQVANELWTFAEVGDWEPGSNSINDTFESLQVQIACINSIKADIDRQDRIRERVRTIFRALETAPTPSTWMHFIRREPIQPQQVAGFTMYSAVFTAEIPMEEDA